MEMCLQKWLENKPNAINTHHCVAQVRTFLWGGSQYVSRNCCFRINYFTAGNFPLAVDKTFEVVSNMSPCSINKSRGFCSALHWLFLFLLAAGFFSRGSEWDVEWDGKRWGDNIQRRRISSPRYLCVTCDTYFHAVWRLIPEIGTDSSALTLLLRMKVNVLISSDSL